MLGTCKCYVKGPACPIGYFFCRPINVQLYYRHDTRKRNWFDFYEHLDSID